MLRLPSIATPLLAMFACACLAADAPQRSSSLIPSTPSAPSTQPTTMPAATAAAIPTTAPATMPVVSKEMQTAIDQLADDDARVRQTGQDQLVQMGAAAVEPLKRLVASTGDIEQRTGAQAALVRIDEMALTGPTMITLKMENATAGEIVAALSKQAGLKLRNGDSNKSKKYSIAIDGQPFWTAAREVCKVTGLKINPNEGNNQIGFSRGDNNLPGPYWVDGPFMIVATSINTSTDIELSRPGTINRQQSIQFTCFAEPKLRINQRPTTVHLTEAMDDKGTSMLINDQEGMDNGFDGGNQGMWEATANLNPSDPAATKITRLRGALQIVATTKTDLLEVADILKAKNVTRTAGGQSLTVRNVTANGEEVTVNVLLSASNQFNDGGYQMMQNVRLLDAQGHPLQSSGVNGGGGMNGRIEFHLTFSQRGDGKNKTGEAAKLVLAVPTESKTMDCNFEMKDLPLK